MNLYNFFFFPFFFNTALVWCHSRCAAGENLHGGECKWLDTVRNNRRCRGFGAGGQGTGRVYA